jgi:hypothetical protein
MVATRHQKPKVGASTTGITSKPMEILQRRQLGHLLTLSLLLLRRPLMVRKQLVEIRAMATKRLLAIKKNLLLKKKPLVKRTSPHGYHHRAYHLFQAP